jgi:hypothetical protein
MERTVAAKPTRGEAEVVRAMGMVGVLGDGVLGRVEPRDNGGVAGEGLRVTVMYSYSGLKLCRSSTLG